MRNIIFLFTALIFLGPNVFAQADIHKVDFKNFTYLPSCTDFEDLKGREKITVKNGDFSRSKETDGYTDHFEFTIFAVTFGDVNGDGKDEAIALSVCNTGGTGQFTEGFVYTIKAGKPSLLARIPGGDRADGGLRSAKVESALLVIETNDPGEGGGACCPQVIVTSRYRVQGSKLVEMGKAERRDVFPTQRVLFSRGMSSAEVKFTIRAEEGKHLVVGARAGQMLTVSVNNEKTLVRLLEDIPDLVTTPNGFRVKLTKNGDHTIELTNYERSAIGVIVTITIK